MEKELIIKYMKEALNLAWSVKGKTSPNPAVGALLVKNGTIISKGATQRTGKDHAEIQALKKATDDMENSTLIITLEPCTFFGKTPPCIDSIIKAKIKEVYIATLDQNEKVNGKGVEFLRKAGIKAEYGFLENEAKKINEDFFKWIKTKLPYITIKYAMTLDGKMATSSHSSKWISSEKAREDSHMLRYYSDAILVGSNTIIQDNPFLTCRIKGKEKCPLRIVIDNKGMIDNTYTIINDELPTVIAIPEENSKLKEYYTNLTDKNKNKIIISVKKKDEFIDINDLFRKLGDFCITSVIVEGGARTLYSCIKQKVADKIIAYIAPKILTGSDGIIPFSGIGPKSIQESILLKNIEYKVIDTDVKVIGYIDNN